jgi:hypothetical protein
MTCYPAGFAALRLSFVFELKSNPLLCPTPERCQDSDRVSSEKKRLQNFVENTALSVSRMDRRLADDRERPRYCANQTPHYCVTLAQVALTLFSPPSSPLVRSHLVQVALNTIREDLVKTTVLMVQSQPIN